MGKAEIMSCVTNGLIGLSALGVVLAIWVSIAIRWYRNRDLSDLARDIVFHAWLGFIFAVVMIFCLVRFVGSFF